MIILQADIDQAVMIAKNAAYKLAYELTLDSKYGGNIDCCMKKLKLLWLYENALSCVQELNPDATPPITETTNCLTQAKVKSLIGKIRSMCTA